MNITSILIKRISDGCYPHANDVCCPNGSGACLQGEACCGDDGCVPLDGSICCSNGGYCKPGRVCASYQNQAVCCLDPGCTELEQTDGGTSTITDGVATPIDTGTLTSVPAGGGSASATTSTLASTRSESSSAEGLPYANATSSVTATTTAGPLVSTTALPSKAPHQSVVTSTNVYPPAQGTSTPQTTAAPPIPSSPVGPTIVIVTTSVRPTVVFSQSTVTAGTTTITPGGTSVGSASPSFDTGSFATTIQIPSWGGLILLFYLIWGL